jgi:Gon7 family
MDQKNGGSVIEKGGETVDQNGGDTMSSAPALTAEYSSPGGASKTFKHELPTCSSDPPTTEERTAYLTELRSSIGQIQDEINVFLTQKMEEDKAQAGAATDDAKAEENYGEEEATSEE